MAKGEKRDASEAGDESRYGEELLCANWTPVIELLQWSCDRSVELTRRPRYVSDEEAAAFLNRVYTFGA
jgi:hypothetical protein